MKITADPDYLIPLDIQDEGDVILASEDGDGAEIDFTFTNGGNELMTLVYLNSQLPGQLINDGWYRL